MNKIWIFSSLRIIHPNGCALCISFRYGFCCIELILRNEKTKGNNLFFNNLTMPKRPRPWALKILAPILPCSRGLWWKYFVLKFNRRKQWKLKKCHVGGLLEVWWEKENFNYRLYVNLHNVDLKVFFALFNSSFRFDILQRYLFWNRKEFRERKNIVKYQFYKKNINYNSVDNNIWAHNIKLLLRDLNAMKKR